MNVQPSTSFEAVAKFPTGLVGSLGVRIIDNVGATTLARFTAGIAEYPAGSGIYQVTLTSPGSAGQYSLIWDDGDGHWAPEDLLVTTEATESVIGSGNLYITVADLRAILGTAGETYDETAVEIAVASASRGIDAFKGTWYYPITQTRIYTARARLDLVLPLDADLISATSVKIDTDDDGTYETTLAAGTDYTLEPVNNALDGKPYTEISLLPRSQYRWPRKPNAVQVNGSFGWASTPAQVQSAAVLLANRFLTRYRQAPLAVLIANANDMVAMARLGSVDPDVAAMLESLPARRSNHASLQLS